MFVHVYSLLVEGLFCETIVLCLSALAAYSNTASKVHNNTIKRLNQENDATGIKNCIKQPVNN